MNKTMTLTASKADFDDFGKNEIKSSSAAPFAQVLAKADPIRINGSFREAFGFAVSAENAEKVNFSAEESDPWEIIEYPFQNGAEIDPIFLSQEPGILVLGSSRLYIRDRQSESKTFHLFTRDKYDKSRHTLVTQYAIFFVSSSGQLMHDIPLLIRMKGVVGAQFAFWYGSPLKRKNQTSSFCDHLRAIAKEMDRPDLIKNANYYAQMIFRPIIKPERKGQGSNSVNLGCIVGWKQPVSRITDPQERLLVNDYVSKILAKEPGWDLDEYFMPKNKAIDLMPSTPVHPAYPDTEFSDDYPPEMYEVF